MTKIPERFIWATELLNLEQNHNILEIGCGAGLMAEQIANLLTEGKYIAVDKSAPMVKKAIKRNQQFIEKEISQFFVSEFLTADLQEAYFDSVTAFNVNIFLKNPTKELKLIKQVLKPSGKLYVFYQAPYELDKEEVESIKRKILDNSYEIIDYKRKKLEPASAICIIAKHVGL